MTAILIPTADGRVLETLVSGDAELPAILYHSGTPSAAVPNPPFEEAAAAAGLRLVTYSRPGYGASSPRPAPGTIADDVPDTVTVLDHLGIDTFLTLGWSGGGPRALACAALLPDRCRAAVTLAGVAPYDAEGLDWTAGMAGENEAEFAAAAAGVEAYGAYLEAEAMPMLTAPVEALVEAMGDLLSDVDKAAVGPDYAALVAASFHHSVAQGVVGIRDDGLAEVAPWGFDLGSITVPVAVWQGDQDAMVPFAHGEWLASRIPGAVPHLLPGEGHMSVAARIDEMLAELKELGGL